MKGLRTGLAAVVRFVMTLGRIDRRLTNNYLGINRDTEPTTGLRTGLRILGRLILLGLAVFGAFMVLFIGVFWYACYRGC